jgi:hydrophobic/amphiphilic exporter-1 (mainly G- bacteria), HAE1 family
MSLLALCTRRPVAVSMVTLAVMLFGSVALSRLPVTLLPDLTYPRLTVRTELPGAAPAEVETLLSKPIEEAVGAIKNVRRVLSVSRAGVSDVTLEFNWGTVMDYAVLDIREKLDALILPDEAIRPIVLRFDPSEDPILRMGLSLEGEVDQAALKRLRRVAEDLIQKPLEAATGVAAVKISGGLEEEIEVRVDLPRLSQLNLTLEQVQTRLAEENANLSGGRVEEGTATYLVRTLNQFRSLEDMREVLVTTVDGRNIYLGDIAEVIAGFKQREAIIRVAGREAVEIAIYKEGDGNTIAVADEVRRQIERLEKQIPPELELKTLYDQSDFIRQAIAGVSNAALGGGILAVIVLYFFLRNAWSTLVIALAIPVSIVATFNLMYGAGLSLNIMSLGGLALAIGMLVDNAIVVLESIARRREAGDAPLVAAETGARTVAGAITASTLTTVAVFFPMIFVEGIAGQLFSDQSLVVSGALVISLLISLTLIPMLAARRRETPLPPAPAAPRVTQGSALRRGLSTVRVGLLETGPALIAHAAGAVWRGLTWTLTRISDPPVRAFQAGFAALERAYVPLLDGALRRRGTVVGLALLALLASGGLGQQLGLQLIPPFGQGEFTAQVRLPPGTPLRDTDAVLARLQDQLGADPRLAARYSVAGSGNRLDASPEAGGEHTGTLSIVLAPGQLDAEAAVQADLNAGFAREPGLAWRYTKPTLFTLSDPLEIEFSGYDLAALERVSESLQSRLLADARFTGVKSSLLPGYPEIRIVFDQAKAARLGLDVAALARRVVTAVQGSVATRYRYGDREIDILVRGEAREQLSLEKVRRLIVNPESSRPVTLDAVAEVQLTTGPSEIRRARGTRNVVVSTALAYGDLGAAVAAVEGHLAQTVLPPGVAVTISGQQEEMASSFASLQFALALAIFLVYLVMASQFESLKHPFVILFTIPLSLIGAVLALAIGGFNIDVVVLIGGIVLAGIVVNNGIVLVDAINQQRAQGQDRHAAILEAGRLRLRPILMTTMTTVLGLLPLALGLGDGAEVQQPMAVTVIGGLLMSTLLTLVVIPVVYTLVDGRERAPEGVPA